LNPIEKAVAAAGIVFGAIGGLSFLAGTDFIIPFIWRGVILTIGVIAIILSLFLHRFTRGKVEPLRVPQVQPSINYGRIIVRNTRQSTHDGVYDERRYYVEIVNETPNTVARNCRGSLDMPTEEIRGYTTVWENRSATIDIGHDELLYLFDVTVFNKEAERTLTLLYFHGQERIVDRRAEDSYNNKLDRRLKVLIQSENARFPSEPESLNMTIRQIINDALQE
jgi:hypothetical protein